MSKRYRQEWLTAVCNAFLKLSTKHKSTVEMKVVSQISECFWKINNRRLHNIVAFLYTNLKQS